MDAILGAGSLAKRYDEVDEGTQIAEKAGELIPREATVIVPPSWENFRERSRRSSFVTWKDRGPVTISRQYALYWLERMNRLRAFPNGDFSRFDDGLQLTAEEVREISQTYQAIHLDYIATSRTYPFPLLAEVGRFRLYRIPPVGEDLSGKDKAR